jgi:hypothetical protein
MTVNNARARRVSGFIVHNSYKEKQITMDNGNN